MSNHFNRQRPFTPSRRPYPAPATILGGRRDRDPDTPPSPTERDRQSQSVFSLQGEVGPGRRNSSPDVLALRRALAWAGHLPRERATDQSETDDRLFNAVASFQKAAGLKVDGLLKPRGETVRALDSEIGPKVQQYLQDRTDETPSRQGTVSIPIPFPVWLMVVLGTATTGQAMAIFSTWGRKKQNEIKKRYGDETGDKYEFCRQRFQEEFDRCFIWDKKWWHGCIERASNRRNLCFDNGGIPHPDEPKEWGPEDMEVTPTTPRRRRR